MDPQNDTLSLQTEATILQIFRLRRAKIPFVSTNVLSTSRRIMSRDCDLYNTGNYDNHISSLILSNGKVTKPKRNVGGAGSLNSIK